MACGYSQQDRQRWMGVLARAPIQELERVWEAEPQRPEYGFLRPPETGMVMVRARVQGDGQPFNFGEVPVTRCTVKTEMGFSGCAYVKGTLVRHAEIAAVLDAMLQDGSARARVLETVIEPLAVKLAEAKGRAAEKRGATRVDFFTMVRGE